MQFKVLPNDREAKMLSRKYRNMECVKAYQARFLLKFKLEIIKN